MTDEELSTDFVRPEPGVIEHPLYLALAEAHLTNLTRLREVEREAARLREAVEALLPSIGRYKACQRALHTVGVSYETSGRILSDLRDGLGQDIRAALAAGDNPTACNCGWGGTHDPDNPRCAAYIPPVHYGDDGGAV